MTRYKHKMGKLTFIHGVMGSAKTASLIDTANIYKKQNKKVFIVKPSLDTRCDEKQTVSRNGNYIAVDILVHGKTIIPGLVPSYIDYLLVDESQFLKPMHVEQLRYIASEICDVICYGLKTSYDSTMFPSSKRLLELADLTSELYIKCFFCDNTATLNMKYTNGKSIKKLTHQIDIGGDEKYKSVCYDCWRLE